ncbi:hypothetical protein AL712_28740, partial [Bacillus thuringiensis]
EVHCTSKRWSLFEYLAFVYIEPEWFQYLLSYVKHDEDFETLQIWQNVSLHAYNLVQLDCLNA